MIDVSNNLKNVYNQSTSQIDRIKINNDYYYIRNVEYSDDCYEDGNIFGTAIARIITFEIDSSIEMEKKEFQYETGVMIGNTPVFISLGNFIVTDTEEGDTTEITKVTAMDYMLKTNIKYNSNLNYSSATILDVLVEVCTNCGISLASTTFTNSTFRVDSNQFDDSTLCRQVIQAIAQISGTVAKIKNDNRLYLINPNQVTDVSQVFTLKEYSEADIKRLTHPLNLVSLASSQIEGENITLRDEDSIALDGQNSLIINDNPFAYNQDKRTQLITPLFNAVKGFEYKSYSFKFQMLPYIETLDKIQFLDKNGNTYNSYVFRFNYKSPNGLDSTIEAPSLTRATINYQNIPNALEVAKRTEIIVDKQNQTIESVISNVDEQNTKIARVQQTVDSLNSKISDIADITTSQETNIGSLTFENINQSEPIHIEIRPIGENIDYLHPFETLYPSNSLYVKLRTLRFTNTDTNEVSDYELPDDLLFYDNENYDEFIWDYDSQTIYINKKCKYNTSTGAVELLAEPVTNEYTFPHINLTDGDYTVKILKYDNTPYVAYLAVRLMAQNIYTTQFATKSEVNSEISQTADSITAQVNQTLTNYSTTSQMNSAINLKANEINSSVSEIYATKTALNTATSTLNSTINQRADSITSSVANTYATKNELNTTKNNLTSTINQTANSITSSVASTYATKNELNNYSTTTQMNSAINQKADSISSTVSTKVGNNEIISKINQSSEAVTINANKIDIDGKAVHFKTNISVRIGPFTNQDKTKLVNYLMGTGTLTAEEKQRYNIKGDGTLDSADVVFMQRAINNGGYYTFSGYYEIDPYSYSKSVRIYDNNFNSFQVILSLMYNYIDYLYTGGLKVNGQLVVENEYGKMFTTSNHNNTRFELYTDGDIRAEHQITCENLIQTSKKENKKNFEKFQNALNIIKSIDIYKYNMKSQEDKDKKHIGFVIGDDFNYSEEVTSENNDGVDLYSFVSLCCKAIQEQQDKIDKLEQEIKTLKEER